MWMARVILKCWGYITYYIAQLKRRKTDLLKTYTSNRMEPLFTALRMSCSTLYLEQNSHHLKEMWVQLAPLFTRFKSVRFFLMGPPKGAGVQGPGTYTTVEELKDSIRREIRKLNRNKDMFNVHGRVWQFSGSWSMCKIIELYNYWTAYNIHIGNIKLYWTV